MAEHIKNLIGRHQYAQLKNLEGLTEEQKEKTARYEKAKAPSSESIAQAKAYAPTRELSLKIEPRGLYELFIKTFQKTQGKAFIQTPQSLENLKSLIYYFTQDQKFLQSKTLTHLSTPSLQKGLLIIGSYGCGKTSMMRTFEKIFAYLLPGSPQSFKTYEANQIVEMYESCQTPADKEYFQKIISQGTRHFDDVKTEREASNYGKANLMKDIIEKRYAKKKKTHMSCNYAPRRPQDPQAALEEFGQLYGPRVYDRLIEMCNILQFKGQSFRK